MRPIHLLILSALFFPFSSNAFDLLFLKQSHTKLHGLDKKFQKDVQEFIQHGRKCSPGFKSQAAEQALKEFGQVVPAEAENLAAADKYFSNPTNGLDLSTTNIMDGAEQNNYQNALQKYQTANQHLQRSKIAKAKVDELVQRMKKNYSLAGPHGNAGQNFYVDAKEKSGCVDKYQKLLQKISHTGATHKGAERTSAGRDEGALPQAANTIDTAAAYLQQRTTALKAYADRVKPK